MPAEPWVSEAIIDFLRGPLYTHPLMEFIDAKCLIFTTEEENKLEYTQIHNEFKDLVDKLLTDFLEELGTKPEEFFETITQQLDKDKFTEFVVNTILTVDDFLMFKAMMVRRNVDLTNQVLEAMEELRKASLLQQAQGGPEAHRQAGDTGDEELKQALQASISVHDTENQHQKLLNMMRRLQLEDEDVAMAIAMAESFKESAALQAELAEIEMAIALSLALEEERKRVAAQPAACKAADGASTSSVKDSQAAPKAAPKAAAAPAAPAARAAAPKPASAVVPTVAEAASEPPSLDPPKLQYRPFPEPKPMDLGPLPKLGEARQVGSKRPPPAIEPLEPPKVGPNLASEKMSSIAAVAAAAAATVSQPAAKPAAPTSQPKKEGSVITPTPLKLEEQPPGPAPSETPRPSGRFVPAPLNLGVPAPPRAIQASSSTQQRDSSQSLGKFGGSFNTHNRAAGFQSGSTSSSTDLAAIRKAAMEAAATQKNLMLGKRVAGGDANDESMNAWLQEAKLKLVAQKKLEREAEMQAYAAEKGQKHGKKNEGEAGSDIEAKRAALRDKLAAKFKQDLINQ